MQQSQLYNYKLQMSVGLQQAYASTGVKDYFLKKCRTKEFLEIIQHNLNRRFKSWSEGYASKVKYVIVKWNELETGTQGESSREKLITANDKSRLNYFKRGVNKRYKFVSDPAQNKALT